ncbi:Uncharacterized protein FKW44_000835, partial [Caligus rogercresseyi]
ERVKKKESVAESLRITNIHLERAEHLSYSLEEECTRWRGQLQTAERQLNNLLGDSLILSFIVGYAGNLSENSRNELINQWKKLLSRFNISYSENEGELYGLEVGKLELQRWNECKYYVQNALVTKYTNKWPLYIDPCNVALKEALRLPSGHSIIHSSDLEFGAKLRSSLSEGSACIIKDFNFDFPSEFANLFQRNLYEKVRVFVGLIGIPKMRKDVRVKLGTTVMEEVAVGSKFALYLHSQDMTFPQMDDKINAISYNLTKEALYLKLREEIMKKMDKDFAEKLDQVVRQMEKMSEEVNAKIRNVLLVFIESKDSMLENDRLIASLK